MGIKTRQHLYVSLNGFHIGKLLIVSVIISVKEWLVFSTKVKYFPMDLNGLSIPLPIPA
jgi:hypothetical protein